MFEKPVVTILFGFSGMFFPPNKKRRRCPPWTPSLGLFVK
nr:MAG TPA: hypothetical protein [Caudoviricetes sp.]